jgi:hypothetical protein
MPGSDEVILVTAAELQTELGALLVVLQMAAVM